MRFLATSAERSNFSGRGETIYESLQRRRHHYRAAADAAAADAAASPAADELINEAAATTTTSTMQPPCGVRTISTPPLVCPGDDLYPSAGSGGCGRRARRSDSGRSPDATTSATCKLIL